MTGAALSSFRSRHRIRHHLPLVLCRQAPTRSGAPHFGSRRAHVRCSLASFPAKPDHAEGRPRSARIPLS